MYIQFFITATHVFWCWLFTDHMELGLRGCALSMSVAHLINLLIMHSYTSFYTDLKMRQQAWFSIFDKANFKECFDSQGLLHYYKLGMSSIGMISLEWWCYEIMMVFAARLGVMASATQIIMMNFNSLAFMFPAGLQISSVVLVGREIGAQNPKLAKRYSNLILCIGLGLGVIISLSMWMIRGPVSSLYTNIDEIRDNAAQVLRMLSPYFIFDSWQCVASGQMRGIGKTVPATAITLIAYYGISIPLQFTFTVYFDFGLYGLWLAQIVASLFHCVSEQYLISFAYGDWEVLCREAAERIKRDQERLDEIRKQYELSLDKGGHAELLEMAQKPTNANINAAGIKGVS
jgi:MATE family multidrug resistance protein